MNSVLWWRRMFLVSVLLIVLLMVISIAKAVLLTPVAVENKQRLEEKFHQSNQEAVKEYEEGVRGHK